MIDGVMPVTGTTRCFPLIGHPVAQVRTPPLINGWFSAHGIDATMFGMDILPEATEDFFKVLRAWSNCGGCSVTVPHKQAAFRSMDQLTDRARHAAAVNIVRRMNDGRLIGDMTDGLAFVTALRNRDTPLAGARVLLAGGGGGAGLAIALALADSSIQEICLVEPDPARHARAVALLSDINPHIILTGAPMESGFDLAVNASPMGMRQDDPLPFEPELVRAGGTVADVITKPAMTPLLTKAAACGFLIQDGNAMADAQIPFQMQHLGLFQDEWAA
tara:strand:- start:8108 stop:8932 length:825 start_codon:yes stop_codon:yes gene_type:complete